MNDEADLFGDLRTLELGLMARAIFIYTIHPKEYEISRRQCIAGLT
jgi:hypothetical protein